MAAQPGVSAPLPVSWSALHRSVCLSVCSVLTSWACVAEKRVNYGQMLSRATERRVVECSGRESKAAKLLLMAWNCTGVFDAIMMMMALAYMTVERL